MKLRKYDKFKFKKKIITQLPFILKHLKINWFAHRRWQSQLAALTLHNNDKNNYYIRPHLDARPL